MAIVDYQDPVSLNAASVGSIANFTTLDAAGETSSIIFQCPKAGTITAIDVRTGTLVTTPGTADVRAETVDQTTGFPTGTLVAAGANGSISPAVSSTWYAATLGTPLVVTEGQEIAVVVNNTTGNYRVDLIGGLGIPAYPYCASKLSSVDAKNVSAIGVVALNYGGTYYRTPGVLLGMTALAVNTGTTPDEVGNLFTVPVGMRVSAIQALADFDGACDLLLYDSSNNVLATGSIDLDVRIGTGGGGVRIKLSAQVTLSANTNYRIVFKPSSATSVTMYYFNCLSAAQRSAAGGGAAYQYTSRTDAGSWTENTSRQACIYPLFDGIDAGAGIARLIGEGLVA